MRCLTSSRNSISPNESDWNTDQDATCLMLTQSSLFERPPLFPFAKSSFYEQGRIPVLCFHFLPPIDKSFLRVFAICHSMLVSIKARERKRSSDRSMHQEQLALSLCSVMSNWRNNYRNKRRNESSEPGTTPPPKA